MFETYFRRGENKKKTTKGRTIFFVYCLYKNKIIYNLLKKFNKNYLKFNKINLKTFFFAGPNTIRFNDKINFSEPNMNMYSKA